MIKTEKLGTESVLKLLIKNSIPAILANLVFALYNVVDRIFIGKGLGTEALAGVSLIFPIMTFVIGLEIIASIGAGVLVSIKLGERNKFYAQKILGNIVSVYAVFSLFLIIFGYIFMDKILILCGASSATLPFAREYFSFLLPCFFFQFCSVGLNNVIRAEANIRVAMITIFIATITNVILDPIFIFTFKMGVKGAAIATDIGMIFSSIWVFYHFRISKHRVLSLHIRDLKIDKEIVLSVFSKGFPSFFMQTVSSVIIVILNHTLYKYGGDVAIGAMGIVNTLFFLVFLIIIGLNQGCQPVIGFNFGAKNYFRLTQVMKYCIILGFCITVPVFFLVQIFAKDIVNIFCKDDGMLLSLATRGLKMLLAMVVLLGFNVSAINFFLSIGKSKLAMCLNFLRQGILFIPALIILPRYFKMDGVWYIYPFVDIIMIMFTSTFFYKEYKKFKNLDICMSKNS